MFSSPQLVGYARIAALIYWLAYRRVAAAVAMATSDARIHQPNR